MVCMVCICVGGVCVGLVWVGVWCMCVCAWVVSGCECVWVVCLEGPLSAGPVPAGLGGCSLPLGD